MLSDEGRISSTIGSGVMGLLRLHRTQIAGLDLFECTLIRLFTLLRE